jgi:predicted phosphoadenosine phosphosulfate sulfurtransferase
VRDKAIELMVNPDRFPVECRPDYRDWVDPLYEGQQKLVAVIGLRTSESSKRLMGLHSSGGYMTGSSPMGVFNCRPIYDWGDGDVWKFTKDAKIDYNHAYDTMRMMGIPKAQLRIGPPTMNAAGIEALKMASRAWPQWFDRVCKRLKGVRTAAQFGKRAVEPYRRYGETWEQCYVRENIDTAPDWIRDRAIELMNHVLKTHSRHATTALPETKVCSLCSLNGSWRLMAHNIWGGDPYVSKTATVLKPIQPEFFRPGAGTWAGQYEDKYKGTNIKVTM